MTRAAWALVPLLAAGSVRGQERPSEEDIFGGSPPSAEPPASDTEASPPPPSPPAALAPTATDARDDLNLGDPTAATRFSDELAPEDPLKFGGQLYWRAMSMGKQGQRPDDWSLSTPALLDVYLDARPNERVRAFGLARTTYDPTLPRNGATSDVPTGTPLGSDSLNRPSTSSTRGPSVVLDQLWLRFDILRRVFVTVGKQHVRWGTARFWAPTDYMHEEARNPLLPFDPRTGTTMLKLHVPWEARGWNFYAYALPEGPSATEHTGDIAGAARVEIVLGTLEASAGVFGRRNSKARFAGDVSFGLWDLDFYGEAAVRNAGDIDFVHYEAQPQVDCTQTSAAMLTRDDLMTMYYPAQRGSGWKAQVTGGVSYTRKYADKDTFTLGAEYFYNELGYASAKDYLGLPLFSPREQALANPATFFYLGRHYLGVFATAPAPYSWDNTTFTLSSLANLSDGSGIVRLDYSLIVLTHIRFEAYGAVRYGQKNGEFRMGIDIDVDIPCTDQVQPLSYHTPPALFDLGVGLRVAL
jgi:hypothetical protein